MADQQHLATADHWALVGRMRHHAEFSCLLELLHRIEALEGAQSGSIDLSHLSDAERGKILKMLANPGRFEVLEVAQPAKPDSSLVDRVVDAMFGTEWEARAAIREVAAWLREEKPHMAGTCSYFASSLEQESER